MVLNVLGSQPHKELRVSTREIFLCSLRSKNAPEGILTMTTWLDAHPKLAEGAIISLKDYKPDIRWTIEKVYIPPYTHQVQEVEWHRYWDNNIWYNATAQHWNWPEIPLPGVFFSVTIMLMQKDDKRYRVLVNLQRVDRPKYFTWHCPVCQMAVCEISGAEVTALQDVIDSSRAPLIGVRCNGRYQGGHCHIKYYFSLSDSTHVRRITVTQVSARM